MSTPSSYISQLQGIREALIAKKTPFWCVVHGPEEFLSFYGIQQIKVHYAKAFGKDNVHDYEAKTLDVQALVAELMQPSLFSAHKLIILRHCTGVKPLLQTMAKLTPNAKTSIVMEIPGQKLTKDLNKGYDLHCAAFKPKDAYQWLQYCASSHGLFLSRDAEGLLRECLGDDAATIEREMARLSLLFPHSSPKELIQSQHLAVHMSYLREDQGYLIRDFLFQKQYDKALLFISELLNRQTAALAVLGLLAKHCREGILFCSGDPTCVGQIPEFFRRKYQSASVSLAAYKSALSACYRGDTILKTRSRQDEIVLSEVIFALME